MLRMNTVIGFYGSILPRSVVFNEFRGTSNFTFLSKVHFRSKKLKKKYFQNIPHQKIWWVPRGYFMIWACLHAEKSINKGSGQKTAQRAPGCYIDYLLKHTRARWFSIFHRISRVAKTPIVPSLVSISKIVTRSISAVVSPIRALIANFKI